MRIRKFKAISHKINTDKPFRFVIKALGNEARMLNSGLDGMSIGECRLPSSIGPVTRFNNQGRSIKLKHLPKVTKYTHSMLLEWQAWGHGPTLSKFVDFYRDCYQTNDIQAPSMELALIEKNGESYVSTPIFRLIENTEEEILHAVNVLLEIFGEYRVFIEGEGFKEPIYKRVNWRLIPPGERVFDYVIGHIQKNDISQNRQPVIIERQHFLHNLKPDLVYVGEAGFSDYMAYEFQSKKIVILESIKFGNAIYVFEDDWQQFSKLSKKEIIENEFAERIIHANGWKNQVLDYLN